LSLRATVELGVVATLGIAQTACGSVGHSSDDECPWHPDGYLEKETELPFTWDLPADSEPLLTVSTARLPGPVRRWDVHLTPVEDGWMFDLHGARSNIFVGTPKEPCEGTFGWEMTLELPGRAPWGPLPLPPPIEWETVHACPWDDDANCLEIGLFR
jgi:hypothetical protein